MPLAWTDADIAELKKLWNEGLSASQVAARMSAAVTRNAVIGKIHRLGIRHRAAVVKRRPGVATRKRQLSVLATLPIAPTPLPPQHVDDVARVSFAQLDDHHCRWPVGEPTVGFCGLDKTPGQSYCSGHVARASAQPVTVSERQAWSRHRRVGTNHPILRQNTIHAVDLRELETI